jgi:hypothetical protein
MRASNDFENREQIASVLGCKSDQPELTALAIVASLIEQLKSGGVYIGREPEEMGELGELLRILPKPLPGVTGW